jgi:hypothetical protein
VAFNAGMQPELELMKNKVATLEAALNTRILNPTFGSDAIHNDVASFKIQLKLLEARLPTQHFEIRWSHFSV